MGNHQSHHHGTREQQSSSSSTTPTSRSRSPTLASVPLSDQIVDKGHLEPQSWTYASSTMDYNRQVVHDLIQQRRLCPFYIGLQDFEQDWQTDQILQAFVQADQHADQNLQEALVVAQQAVVDAELNQQTTPTGTRKHKEATVQITQAILNRDRLTDIVKHRHKTQTTRTEQLAQMYIDKAVECPICFLYYPPNMVHTRCCDQPICTECFVQIKRSEPDATHLESEPASCPYCMESNFGCVYQAPTSNKRPVLSTTTNQEGSNASGISIEVTPPKPRRKSFAHTDKEVVTTDQIHPDWESKLEIVKAQVARRANRRIVFRQVGDRLIPVGITSGRQGSTNSTDGSIPTMSSTTLPPGLMAQIAAAMDNNNNSSSSSSSNGGRNRSSRRRTQELGHYLQSMGIDTGPDLEEMMVEEAMRLSLLEDEERKNKQRQQEQEQSKQNFDQSQQQDVSTTMAESSRQGAQRSRPVTPPSPPPPEATPSPPQPQPEQQRDHSTSHQTTPVAPRDPSNSTLSNPNLTRNNQTMIGSIPLSSTTTMNSMTSSVSSVNTVDPLANGAGYQMLDDDAEQ
ncbi:SNF1-interacting protein [Microbotryomycetes sp. JL221]|nr:SNF1-interacting protein [Microbotryomycetes sp. JL221]